MPGNKKSGRKIIDLTGNRYGKLLVVKRDNTPIPDTRDGQARWFCQCDCGNTSVVRSHNLRNGTTKSCGCGKYGIIPANKLPYGEQSKNKLFNDYKKQAKNRNLPFELTKEEFLILTQQKCNYCGCFPSNVIKPSFQGNGEYIYNGIDRVDNYKGYTKDNSVACCEICNRAKKNISVDNFKQWIYRLAEYNR